MACFSAPLAAAIATGIARRGLAAKTVEQPGAISWATKLGWLEKLFFGGCVLLAFEHVWHGEVVPYFPFLTAMQDPESTAEMLHEMATAGVGMAVLVTAAWLAMVAVSALLEKKAVSGKQAKGEGAV